MLKEIGVTSTNNQRIGSLLGAAYVLLGLVGFLVTGLEGFASPDGDRLMVFRLNALHNLIHLLVGVALLVAARAGLEPSRLMNRLVGGVYLVVGLVGIFLLGSAVNILALNHPDNALHIISAVVLISASLKPEAAPTG